MATLTTNCLSLIALAWMPYMLIGYRSLALIAAIALLSYISAIWLAKFLSAGAPTASFHQNKGANLG